MFKLFIFMIMIGLSGCTAHDPFALKLNAQLDACAMKRMAETKFNSQQGYLQAHYECHQIVNIQKGHALHLERVDVSKLNKKDELEEYEICWEFVKGLLIDKYQPDLRLPTRKERGYRSVTDLEAHQELVARNSKTYVLPDKLNDLGKKSLIMVRDMMQTESVIVHDTLCSARKYHELSAIIGREVHRRYPNGVETNVAGSFQ